MKYLKLTLCLIAAITLLIVPSGQASAVSADDFNPGRIIDDNVFFNKDTMTVSQIQKFLDAKVPNCDTNGDKYHNGVRRRDISSSNPPPYTCLKDYYENPETNENNYGDKSKPAGAKSAAQIIYDTAQRHRINPQVLIVTLQKENSLVTDDWPWWGQYKTAMGYACPDDAPCDEEYFGFSNQLEHAAWQFRRYVEYPQYYNYAVGTNYVQYHPTESCGGKRIAIETPATAALYNYTPYQPNQASLNAYPGEGNSCSSYGNRNFWFKFNEWFGSTTGQRTYSWSTNSISLYTDQARTNQIATDTYLEPGQTIYLTLKAKNTGNQVWQQAPLRLGTTDPRDRNSSFCNNSWLSCGRVTKMNEEAVAPGEIATFEASLTAPEKNGKYNENFNLLAENIAWFSGPGLALNLEVEPSRDFAVYSDSNKIHRLQNNRIAAFAGTKNYAVVTVRNTTNSVWPANKTKLATTNPTNRTSVFQDNSWLNGGRVSQLENGELAPGESDKFIFTLTAPDTPGNYTEDFGIVIENQEWIEHDTATLDITVKEHPGDSLKIDQNLRQDEALVSNNGLYRLIMQSDGNLVVYSPRKPIWSTGTHGTSAHRTIVQSDGNVVTYSTKGPVWASETRSSSANRLVMQNDGNLVVYGDGGAIWASGTHGKY